MKRLSQILVLIVMAVWPVSGAPVAHSGLIQTVLGPIPASELGLALEHEHVLVDFIGADAVGPHRYDRDKVFDAVRPHLETAAARGVRALFECTPAWLGRDPALLRRLSEATGVHLVTNTGLYGAAEDKFLPAHAFSETATQLAARWIAEARDGIDGTGIKPGFIKTAVDPAETLSPVDAKLIEAAALTHRETGLTVAVHTGRGPGLSVLEILGQHGVGPSAFVWIHAQSAPDDALESAADAGAWLSFDGLRPPTLGRHLALCIKFRDRDQLGQILVSHDAGWFDPGKPNGGPFTTYELLFQAFLPMLRENGFSEADIARLLVTNPARAFAISTRPRSGQ